MKTAEQERALAAMIETSKTVGRLIRRNLFVSKKIDAESQHDIKLAMDVRCQRLITKTLHSSFPDIPVLGEEGTSGSTTGPRRWVVDPIDGTVNFTYGIPHACVSIALQEKTCTPDRRTFEDGYNTILGVVYDPFCDELWTALRGKPAQLNGRTIRVSARHKLSEAIISIGFAKTRENLEATLPYFLKLVHKVRKLRMMGSAALALTYVASGRFDAYIEGGIRLWDIAAGGLILECAGGEFFHEPAGGDFSYRMISHNGLLRRELGTPVW